MDFDKVKVRQLFDRLISYMYYVYVYKPKQAVFVSWNALRLCPKVEKAPKINQQHEHGEVLQHHTSLLDITGLSLGFPSFAKEQKLLVSH